MRPQTLKIRRGGAEARSNRFRTGIESQYFWGGFVKQKECAMNTG
jgi:hypothetical protein